MMTSKFERPDQGGESPDAGRIECGEQQDLNDQLNDGSSLQQEHLAAQRPADMPTSRAGTGQVNPALPQDAMDAEVKRLAALAPLAYDRERKVAAERLGVRAQTLDDQVERARVRSKSAASKGFDNGMDPIEPWHEPVDGAELLDRLSATINKFAVLPDKAGDAIALWILHTHAHAAAEHSPILALLSPEKRCGKTRVLAIVAELVPNALTTANISTAALFRTIEKFRPTLLIDEVDTFLQSNEDMRGIINSGLDRASAFVMRCHGDDHEPRRFSTWCPKLIAGIGQLPDTIRDRSIIIPLQRKLKNEHVERFRRSHHSELHELRSMAKRWAMDELQRLSNADPVIPPGLNDRAEDAWRPLLAIADAAGGHWPDTARLAALAQSGERADDDDRASQNTQLLGNLREVFSGTKATSLSSTALAKHLNGREDWPWGEIQRGKPLSPRGLAMRLKAYGIRPDHVSTGSVYRRSDFTEVWERYLASTSDDARVNKCQASTNSNDSIVLDGAVRVDASVRSERPMTLDEAPDFGSNSLKQPEITDPWRMVTLLNGGTDGDG